MSELQEWVAGYNEQAMLADGLEAAFIGVASHYGKDPVAVYDVDKCVEVFVADGMDYEEAQEWFDYNVQGAYVGEHTPVFVVTYKGKC